MKLLMTLLVRDEDDILRENIEFHLAHGVDYIIAIDNCSKDGSTDILREYEKQKVLHYIYEQSQEYNQASWVTHMARLAHTHYNADWVINNDADEFWLPIKDKSLKDVIKTLNIDPSIGSFTVNRHNFICLEKLNDQLPFYKNLTFRYRGCVPPKCLHRGSKDVKVFKGNHSVCFPQKKFINKPLTDITILHFPYRGFSQFTKKTKNIITSIENNQNWCGGNHWKALANNISFKQDIKTVFNTHCMSQEILELKLKKAAIVKDERLLNFFMR